MFNMILSFETGKDLTEIGNGQCASMGIDNQSANAL
jgi:hypothetical protein